MALAATIRPIGISIPRGIHQHLWLPLERHQRRIHRRERHRRTSAVSCDPAASRTGAGAGGGWRQRVRFAGGEWRRRNAVRVGRQDPFTRLLVARSSAFCLVAAAGVMLGRDQRQPGAGRSRFRLRGTAEGRQDAENRDICGEYADSNRSDDGYADNDGHQERNHDPPIPGNVVFCPGRGWALRPSAARILNLTCVDAPRC